MSRVLLHLIDTYQRAMEGRPSPCRFHPSCSAYAREAIDVHGARRGTWLAIRRLSRCRPFGPSGWDPVPEPVSSVPFSRADPTGADPTGADHDLPAVPGGCRSDEVNVPVEPASPLASLSPSEG